MRPIDISYHYDLKNRVGEGPIHAIKRFADRENPLGLGTIKTRAFG